MLLHPITLLPKVYVNNQFNDEVSIWLYWTTEKKMVSTAGTTCMLVV